MNDCPNAAVRDLLPDLVHNRLDAVTRAMVEAHVEGCADCKAEVELLHSLRASFRRVPQLDLVAIAAAIPAYRAPVRRSWVGWRTAAAITVLVGGASSVAVLQQRSVTPRVDTVAAGPARVSNAPVPAQTPVTAPGTVPVAATAQTAVRESPAPVASPAIVAPAPPERVADSRTERELAMGGGSLSDLNDRELASLLKDIDSLDAVPSVEVDNTPVAPLAPGVPRRASP